MSGFNMDYTLETSVHMVPYVVHTEPIIQESRFSTFCFLKKPCHPQCAMSIFRLVIFAVLIFGPSRGPRSSAWTSGLMIEGVKTGKKPPMHAQN